jgi:3D-(3,5/4)-trihydroxycyclohexane-1,2-dione acylhydrolase (decyclizing)
LADVAGRSPEKKTWLAACVAKMAEWTKFKQSRVEALAPIDEIYQRRVMTQPEVMKIAGDFASEIGAVKLFDAGDVQANGFQIIEDDQQFETFTETGASFMGFAAAALMASAIADRPRYPRAFSGDGSFIVNPQVLLDGAEHHLRGKLIIFDNGRMSAIAGLQNAQYGAQFRTSDKVAVDYPRMASAFPGVLAVSGGDTPETLRQALARARAHDGLAVVHVPVYGDDPVGGLGVYGSWNVSSWIENVEDPYLHAAI